MVTDRRRTEPQSGYNLVFLLVLFSLLSVMAAAVLPAITKQIQREKEAELIFRGLQYAEAIRVFQQRFGRYPNTLEELLEIEPRSIRQLWPDPMSDDGRWAFVQAAGNQQAGNANGNKADAQGRELTGASAPTSSFQSGISGQPQRPVGPIVGVVSRQKGQAARTFMGKERYEEWRFTAAILPKPQVVPGSALVKRGNVENLGKPFPRGLKPTGLTPDGANLAGGDTPEDLFDDEGDDG